MNYFAYMRISTAEEKGIQKYNRQEKALNKYAEQNHVEFLKSFREDKSGKNFKDRTEFLKLEEALHPDDTVVFKDITRFSREAEQGYKKYMELMNKGINLIFLDNPTVSTDYIKNLLSIAQNQNLVAKTALESTIKLLLIVELDRAEKERTTLIKRITDGMNASAKTQGRKTGQTDKLTEEVKNTIKEYFINRDKTIESICKKHELSRNTVKKYIDIVKQESSSKNI